MQMNSYVVSNAVLDEAHFSFTTENVQERCNFRIRLRDLTEISPFTFAYELTMFILFNFNNWFGIKIHGKFISLRQIIRRKYEESSEAVDLLREGYREGRNEN